VEINKMQDIDSILGIMRGLDDRAPGSLFVDAEVPDAISGNLEQ
jgi:hypothetical protein